MKILFASLFSLFFFSVVVPADVQKFGSELIIAARDGKLDDVKQLVRNVRADFQDGQALTEAAKNGHLEVVRYLVEECFVKLFLTGGAPLFEAATNGYLEVVKYLVACDDGNSAHNRRCRAYIYAARNGHLEIVRYLVDQARVPINFYDGSALILAAGEGKLAVVQYLVDRKPETDEDFVRIREGEDFSIRANIQNGEALIEAAAMGHLYVVKYLIEEGPEETRVRADIQNGEAFFKAVTNGHLDIVKLLLSSGIPANISYGQALIIAADNGHLNVVQYFVDVDPFSVVTPLIPPNIRDGDALISAARNGYLNVVQHLVQVALVPANSQDGKALVEAASYGRFEVVQYLVQVALVPADIQDGMALINSAESGHLPVVEYLLDYGEFTEIQCDSAISKNLNGLIVAMLEDYKRRIIFQRGVEIPGEGEGEVDEIIDSSNSDLQDIKKDDSNSWKPCTVALVLISVAALLGLFVAGYLRFMKHQEENGKGNKMNCNFCEKVEEKGGKERK